MCKDKKEIERLRNKLLDAEEIAYRLENINSLFVPFAAENSPGGSIVAELFSKQIEALQNVVRY